jgi:hypothetical protein
MLRNPTWINPFTGEAIQEALLKILLVTTGLDFGQTAKMDWLSRYSNTNSVGKSASHGCIRMYNKDVEQLFNQVSIGTPVSVVR